MYKYLVPREGLRSRAKASRAVHAKPRGMDHASGRSAHASRIVARRADSLSTTRSSWGVLGYSGVGGVVAPSGVGPYTGWSLRAWGVGVLLYRVYKVYRVLVYRVYTSWGLHPWGPISSFLPSFLVGCFSCGVACSIDPYAYARARAYGKKREHSVLRNSGD